MRIIPLFILVAAVMFANVSYGMQVTPLAVEMESGGGRSQLVVTNPTSRESPIELIVHRFELDEEGNRTEFDDGENDFLIFPPQAIIEPYGRQVIRIQWLGDPDLKSSQHYFVTVKQVPVRTESESRFRINLVFNIRALVSVSPSVGEPDVSVISAELVRGEEDRKLRVSALIENNSNVHGTLRSSDIFLTVKDQAGRELWSFSPNIAARQQGIGVGVLQANSRRRYVFPFEIPADIAPRAVSATVEIDAPRPR